MMVSCFVSVINLYGLDEKIFQHFFPRLTGYIIQALVLRF